MPHDSSKLKNIQLPAQPGDSLAPGVVEVNGTAGGQIDSGPVPSTAEQGVERRACDCEYRIIGMGSYPPVYQVFCAEFIAYERGEDSIPENIYCRVTKRHLP